MPWSKRRRDKRRTIIRRLVLGFLGMTFIPVGWLWHHSTASAPSVMRQYTRVDADQLHIGSYAAPVPDIGLRWPQRPVYPYSVIPGGVRTVPEFKEALLRDRVAAAHYAGFDISRSRVLELKVAKTAYVSYRIKDRVFWTSRTVRLLQGEPVITDGVHYARARCGNRIANVIQGEQWAYEPTESEMDDPVVLSDRTVMPVLFTSVSRPVPSAMESPSLPSETTWLAAPPFGFVTGASSPATPEGGGSAPPPLGFITVASSPAAPKGGGSAAPPHPGVVIHGSSPPWAGSGAGSPYLLPSPEAPRKLPQPPATVVPEPGTLFLIFTGVGFMALRGKWRSRSRQKATGILQKTKDTGR